MKTSIYTLLIIGWVIYSIVKAVSKKKASNVGMTESEDGGQAEKGTSFETSFDSILNAFFDVKDSNNSDIVLPYEETTTENPLENKSEFVDYKQEKPLDSYSGSDNLVSAFTYEEELQEFSDDDNKSVGNQNEELEDTTVVHSFDLRQAVINQVILERPY